MGGMGFYFTALSACNSRLYLQALLIPIVNPMPPIGTGTQYMGVLIDHARGIQPQE